MRKLVALLSLTLAATTVHAQPAVVPDLIKLIENQPDGMDRSTWKEKRRDAARKLAQTKDKRGVPVLIQLAETETFDIVGEIAIEGLGAIGDQSAVPTLQAIVADTSRDKTSRDLAKKALAKLGAPEVAAGGGTTGGGTTTTTTGQGGKTGGGTTTTTTGQGGKTGGGGTTTTGGGTTTTGGGGKTGGGATTTGGGGGGKTGGGTTTTTGGGTTTTGGGTSGGGAITTGGGGGDETGGGTTGLETGGDLSGGAGSSLLGDKQSTTVDGMPTLDDDVIAASQRLTFAIGSVGLRMIKLPADDQPPENSPDTRIDFDADVKALYERRLDTETKAYAVNVGADLIAGYVNPEGRGATRGMLLNLRGTGEARFYANKIYGIGKAAAAFGMQYLAYVDAQDPTQDLKDTQTQLDLQLALGGGFGRIVDVGGAIRVRRLATLLDAGRALGKPIDAATAKKLQLTWWALRSERTTMRALVATIAILREAGILLGEPNAVITYEILTVLRDTQLYMRPQGFDAQLVIGEAYLKRPADMNNPDNCSLPSCGRIEQVIATVGYAQQMQDNKLELSGTGYARYRLFAPDDGTPTPIALGAGARMRRFTYGEHGDPFGALDVSAGLRFSNDGFDEMQTGRNSDKAARFEGELGFTYWVNQASGIRAAAQLQVDQKTYFFGATIQGSYALLDGVFAR